jgi:Tfp pilus assembly protein PilO
MKKYFEQLRPMERRLVIGVAVVVFLIINWWQVWPHFSDWGDLSRRMNDAHAKLGLYQTAVTQIPKLRAEVNAFEDSGDVVAPEDQGIDLMRTIHEQASACGFGIENYSRQTTRTNDLFYIKQFQNITVLATEEQLVDFLYKLGSGASMIRVYDLELQPDSPHYHLTANIRLVASYQKNSKTTGAAKAGAARTPAPEGSTALSLPAKNASIFGNTKRATNSIFGNAKRATNSTVLKK